MIPIAPGNFRPMYLTSSQPNEAVVNKQGALELKTKHCTSLGLKKDFNVPVISIPAVVRINFAASLTILVMPVFMSDHV